MNNYICQLQYKRNNTVYRLMYLSLILYTNKTESDGRQWHEYEWHAALICSDFSLDTYFLRLIKTNVFDFDTSYLTTRLIQNFYANYKINKSLLNYL